MTPRRNGLFTQRLAATSVPILLCLLTWGDVAAVESSPIAYVTSEASGAVVGVDAVSLKTVRQFAVGSRPHNLKVTADGLLVIATQGTQTVSVVDPTTDPATINRIDIGMPPHDMAVSPDGRTVVVASGGGLLATLDPASGRILQKVGLKGRPHNVIVWRGAAWITDISARRILFVDGEKVQALPISVVGHDLAARPDAEELWVTPWDSDRIVILDSNTQREVAAFRVGKTPSHKHLAFTQDGREAWITEPESGSLFVVNAQTRQVVERVDLRGHPHHVRFADGRAFVVVGPGDLVVLDMRTRGVLGRIAVGSEVHDVGLRPAR